ncbi:MAG: HTTM domain-containing protein [Paracoccus sp. (in: a-proteobacteria)]|uniref:HTTM domain-containing protein n=1 Tax=Paracoccus sp. TaxID=267 RepID=UPI0026E099A6|nr:HTTM domain-containing protein [Paracoccus sp. (in: a-proteobacteria)]MDO5632171.1 HTTM domain-containing protein [Paracoccus sp. (in: a-proteobacteria)]
MKRLSQPVSIQSLAAFRFFFGALLVWDCWRFIHHDRISRYWVEPEILFPYPGFGWLKPLPEPYIHWLWLAMGAAALCVMVGLFYRVAIVILVAVFAYFFLLDRAEYLNHFYLVILFGILLIFMPASRGYSLDAMLRPRQRGETVAYAAPFMLKAQMEIMLVYAGLVKLTPDWLAGQPLEIWLREVADPGPFGFLFQYDVFFPIISWMVIALHVLGAPLLLWERTRLAVFLIYCVFHISNSFYFNIGIFPWMTIAASTIFFASDWPQRLARWLLAWFQPLPPMPVLGPQPARPLPAALLIAMGAWLTVQVALPVRGVLFPDSEIRWSGEGHRFSWRMRIYDREAFGTFFVTAPGAGGAEQVWVVDPTDHLSPRQADKMLVRADLIHAFALALKDKWAKAGHGDVAVFADVQKSLNGRPFQTFIDPTVDLTQVRPHPLRSNEWVRPLEIATWGASNGHGG